MTTLQRETLTVAAYRHLLTFGSITSLLGTDDAWGPWVFSWNPHADLEGSGKQAVVLSHEGSWTSSNRHNTMAFPRLRVQCWSDPDRDAQRQIADQNARDKAWDVWLAVRAVLHRVGGFMEQWSPSVWVCGSYCLDEPVWPLENTLDQPGYWEGYFALSALYVTPPA